MRALSSEVAGGPAALVLRELPDPTVGPGQVRIAVRCCGVISDALLIEDKYQMRPPRPSRRVEPRGHRPGGADVDES
jgi:NADPH:quinone reductase-like Zn-dependent oxidoreductase